MGWVAWLEQKEFGQEKQRKSKTRDKTRQPILWWRFGERKHSCGWHWRQKEKVIKCLHQNYPILVISLSLSIHTAVSQARFDSIFALVNTTRNNFKMSGKKIMCWVRILDRKKLVNLIKQSFIEPLFFFGLVVPHVQVSELDFWLILILHMIWFYSDLHYWWSIIRHNLNRSLSLWSLYKYF